MVRGKCFVAVYQLRKGKSMGLALKYFYMIHRGGRNVMWYETGVMWYETGVMWYETALSSTRCHVVEVRTETRVMSCGMPHV